MKALIFNNKIVQVVETEFEVHKDLHFMDCPDNCVAHDWTLVDGVITEPTPKIDDGLDYQRKRRSEYPSIADQLDDIYHNGIDAWKATIKVTKDKYPK
jgi:hypothetical protein